VKPSYLTVERDQAGQWKRVASDGDWATRIEWHCNDEQWTATMTWHIPRETTAGTYRMSYLEQVVGEFAVTSST
jgi:hypothetical protein